MTNQNSTEIVDGNGKKNQQDQRRRTETIKKQAGNKQPEVSQTMMRVKGFEKIVHEKNDRQEEKKEWQT